MSIALLNPFIFPAPVTITRTYYDAGYTTATTAVNTTQATHKTISTTETSGDKFAFFWQSLFAHAGTTSDVIGILNESPTERQRFNLEAQDATDIFSMGGAYAYTGGTNRTMTLESIEESAATNDIRNYSLSALKLVTSDGFGSSAGQTDSTSTTYVAKTSVTVGPGTWLIIASASVLQSAAGVSKVRVFDGTTTLAEQSGTFYAQDTTNWVPFWHVERVTTTAASTTFSIDNGRVGATGTASIRQASIVALDLSQFDNTYYAEQRTNQTTTSTTAWAGTGLSNAFTFANPANKHLLIAAAWLNNSQTNRSANARLFNTTSSTDYTGSHTREANATTEFYPTIVCRVVTFANATETIEWEHYMSAAGTSTLGEIAIAILDLGTTV